MGRPPAEKPRSVMIAYRVDEDMANAIDRAIKAAQRPGEVLSRNDMARLLMAWGLQNSKGKMR